MTQRDHSTPERMSAWRQHRYGGPETLRREEVPVPTPRAGEVLLRVAATGLNSADVRLLRGEPLLVRLAFGLRRPKNPVRGMDVAGVVVGVGPDVTSFAIGDDVVGELSGGGLAPYATAPARLLARRPESVSVVAAAATPMAAGTAWQALERGGVAAGDRVLVLGASGGVGHFAVQLATSRGAVVEATCGDRNRAFIAGLGAQTTWDYGTTPIEALPHGAYDVVIDVAGTAALRALRALLRPGGRAVLVAGEGSRLLGPMGRLLRATILSIGSRRPLLPLAAVAKPEITSSLLARVADGSLRPMIERTWPLAEANDAVAHVDAGHTVGKVVVEVA